MPEKETIERAREDEREGKSPSTQAGEFVREEMEHIREGEHGARSPEQAIAIGLSKARRAGVKLPLPKRSDQGPRRTPQKAFSSTFACDEGCVETREQQVSIEERALTTCKAGCSTTVCDVPLGCRKESGTYKQTSPLRVSPQFA
jgi:hypothetical protein